jgi:hypothetical protein
MERLGRFHRRWREQAEGRYGLYRSYKQYADSYRKLSANDADDFWASMRSTFGTELFIPHTFAAVETTVPRMMSNRPRMLVLPRDRPSESNVETMKLLIDAQQEQIRYEMALQPIVKTGLIYGFAVQKTFWHTELRDKTRWVQRLVPEPDKPDFVTKTQQEVAFDDPDIAEVDPFDFFYDPTGYDMRTVEWVVHRTWRNVEYIRKQVESGNWKNLTIDEVDALGDGATGRDDIWRERLAAAGYDEADLKHNKMHEVWEFHDRKQVITVLNKEICVAHGENPYWHGELPFQVYRPSVVPQEMPGIGIVEPMEDLQREMNMLRSTRRDNALIALMKPIAYWDGLVDPDEIRFGAGSLIGVPGDPRELLRPLEIGEVPGSSYQEGQAIEADIERVTGISDALAGGDTSGRTFATATGAQIVQQATSLRIGNMTRRAEFELIAPACAQWIALNQQKIVSPRDVRVSSTPQPGELHGKRWTWAKVSPNEMAGQFEVVPEGGATEPANIPQDRQDAQMLIQLFGQSPLVDQRRIIVKALEKFGLKQAETYIAPTQPAVDPQIVGQILVEQGGMDPAAVNQVLQAGQLAYERNTQGSGEPTDAESLLAEITGQAGQPNGGPPQDENAVG